MTSILRGSELVRTVERLAPRSASIGSTRVAIQAGVKPKATPVSNETPQANSSTGTEGDALMGMAAIPATGGNAKYKIRRVPSKAISRPAAPPKRESRMLSVRGFLTSR